MSKLAFIYPGQGVQIVGMGRDFYENSQVAEVMYEKASETLKLDMKKLCFEQNDRLDLTEYTQAALVTTYLAMTRTLEELTGIRPEITAGLSLGEYAALAETGAVNDMDAIRLVRKRGILMQNTVPPKEGAMCAVLGLAAETVSAVIKEIPDVTIANDNCPGQLVITGKTDAMPAAAEALKAAGARRTVMLNVSGPFHSPMLESAGRELEKELQGISIRKPRIPYVTNVTAQKVEEAASIRQLLARQVASPVLWRQSMEYMIAAGVDTFVEIGPGKTLEGFLRKIDRSVKVYHVSVWEDVLQLDHALLKM